jgi:uncharacterized protein
VAFQAMFPIRKKRHMIHKFDRKGTFIVLDINSGAVHVVDEMVYKILDHYPLKTKLETQKALKSTYDLHLVSDAIDEIDLLIEAEQLFTKDTYIKSLEFQNRKPVIKAMCLHIAHDCDLRCNYCFASQGDFQGERSLMSEAVGKKALKFLVDNSGNRRNLEVDFFGGEPLMNFDVVKSLVTYGRSLEKENNKNFRFTLTTNGMKLNDDIIDYVNEHMDNVVLSLDGLKETNDLMRPTINNKGSYDIIVPKFKKLIEKRKDKAYYIRGTFTKFNREFAKDVIHMSDIGFKSTSVEPVVTDPKHSYALSEEDLEVVCKEYDKLADVYLERHGTEKAFSFFHFNVDLSQGPCIVKRLSGCGAGSEYVAITPEGDIYPCHQFVGDETFKLGSVVENNYNNHLSHVFKEAHVYNKEKCQSCWAKFYCSGGCHANAYNFNDDINIPYDLGCELEKKRLESALYIQAKLMEEKNDFNL